MLETDELETDWPLNWREYIHADPNILVGKPVVRGTRLSVEFLLGLFAGGWTEELVLENYPQLTRDGLRAAFIYCAESISGRSSDLPVP